MSEKVLDRIKEILDGMDIEYDLTEHEPVRTSEEAAAARGTDLKEGVKSMVLEREDEKFVMSLVPANRKVDMEKVSKLIGANITLADPDDVYNRTDCKVGSVPPFGFEDEMETYMDKGILENDKINFNAGLKTVSIEMNPKDLKRVVQPEICNISG